LASFIAEAIEKVLSKRTRLRIGVGQGVMVGVEGRARLERSDASARKVR
jgi:hypothetical protein